MLELILAVIIAGAPSQDSSESDDRDFFKGKWKIESQSLVITFLGGDSLKVTSPEDETIQGRGTYSLNDTSFTAEVLNNEMKLKMQYLYKTLEDTSKIKARNIFFSVDGDTINQPDVWTTMEKCKKESTEKKGKENSTNVQ